MVNNASNTVLPEIQVLKEISESSPPSEHIVQAFDYWFNVEPRRLSSRTFIKLQLCEGTLGHYLAERQSANSPVPSLTLVEIMIQILDGVCHCQERKVAHRDLKESNSIFLVQVDFSLLLSLVCLRILFVPSQPPLKHEVPNLRLWFQRPGSRQRCRCYIVPRTWNSKVQSPGITPLHSHCLSTFRHLECCLYSV